MGVVILPVMAALQKHSGLERGIRHDTRLLGMAHRRQSKTLLELFVGY